MLWPQLSDREHVAREWSRSCDFECEVTCKDGRVRRIQWQAMSDRFPVDGWSMWAIGNDGKVIEEVHEATTENERTREVLFHAISESVLQLDREGRVLTCNEAAARRLNRSTQELIGTRIFDHLASVADPDTCARRQARFIEVLHSGEPVHFIDERGDFVLDSTVYPVLDDTGRTASVFVVAHDVTEQRKAQKELHEYHTRMRHAERLASLGMLSATLAHELTQPLSVIRLANQTALAELSKLTCPEAVKSDLQASLNASETITAIIGRFRDFARHSTGSGRETDVHIHRVAERTIRLLEQIARQAKVRLRVENLDTLPAIRMRENELEQLFFTLAENAVQAADGVEDRCLLIAGALQDGRIVLQFQDTCGGIEPKHLPRIFEPFFTTKPQGRGTGLGLWIAHRIAHARGGQISVQNRYGHGATFTVTLPGN